MKGSLVLVFQAVRCSRPFIITAKNNARRGGIGKRMMRLSKVTNNNSKGNRWDEKTNSVLH